MRKATKNWLDMADYDVETARYMLQTGRYIYVIFMCHLAIEKMLKAVVSEATGKMPPKSHNLIFLMAEANVAPPQELRDFIGKISNASIVTRYPEDLSKQIANYPRPVAEDYMRCTEEVIAWLRRDPRLQES